MRRQHVAYLAPPGEDTFEFDHNGGDTDTIFDFDDDVDEIELNRFGAVTVTNFTVTEIVNNVSTVLTGAHKRLSTMIPAASAPVGRAQTEFAPR